MRARAPVDSVARFAIVGCVNFVVSFAVFFLSFYYLPESAVGALARLAGFAGVATLPRAGVANVLAYVAGMVNSFVLNRSWTFRASGNAVPQALKFTAVNVFSLALSTLAAFAFVDVLGYPALVWVLLDILVVVVNYVGCKYWAFAPARLEPEAR